VNSVLHTDLFLRGTTDKFAATFLSQADRRRATRQVVIAMLGTQASRTGPEMRASEVSGGIRKA